jgi:iron complex transport system substrate-binding protein
MSLRRSRTIPSLLLAAALVGGGSLTACGVGASNGSGSAGDADETSFDAAMDDLPADTGLPAAASTKGVSYAPYVGDVSPVSDDVSPSLPTSVTDADGRDVTVDSVDRIVPLDISGELSRTVAGLGLRDNIVGRSVSSMEPSLKDVPVVTQGGHSINAEAVLNLRPTLVLLNHSIGPDDAVDQIRNAGVPVVMLEDPEFTDGKIGEDIRTTAGVLGLADEGEKLASRATDEYDRAKDKVSELAGAADGGKPLRMAFLYARGDGGVFYILGPDSGTATLIESLGGTDVAKENGITDMTPANAEALAKMNPDVLVMMSGGLESTGGIDGLLSKPGVAQTTAGQHRRILAIPDSQALSFGPQSGEMLLGAAAALYAPDDHREATAS